VLEHDTPWKITQEKKLYSLADRFNLFLLVADRLTGADRLTDQPITALDVRRVARQPDLIDPITTEELHAFVVSTLIPAVESEIAQRAELVNVRVPKAVRDRYGADPGALRDAVYSLTTPLQQVLILDYISLRRIGRQTHALRKPLGMLPTQWDHHWAQVNTLVKHVLAAHTRLERACEQGDKDGAEKAVQTLRALGMPVETTLDTHLKRRGFENLRSRAKLYELGLDLDKLK
jgi:hypothetical protein